MSQLQVWEEVAQVTELTPGGRLSVYVDDTPALLFQIGNTYYCVEDTCTHDNEPLTDADLCKNDITGEPAIECPRHGARFDLKTGAALCMPATEPVRVFEVRIVDNFIQARPASGKVTPYKYEPSVKPQEKTTADTSTETSVSDVNIPGASPKHIEALRTVIDPELFINIIDLGLVYGIKQDGGNVEVEMTLTSPACPAGPQLIQAARLSLEKLSDIEHAEIKLVMTPPWGPEKMTDEARDQLGIF